MLPCWGGDHLDVVFLDVRHRVEQDLAAGHVMLVERPERLEIALVLGHQGEALGVAAEQVAGEQHAGGGVQGGERSGKVGIGGEQELQFPSAGLQDPVVGFDAPGGQVDIVVLQQLSAPPMADDTGIRAPHQGIDIGQRCGDIGVGVLADEVPDPLERHHLGDLVERPAEVPFRTGVDENRIGAGLDQITMGLEHLIFAVVADPPDVRCDQDRIRGLRLAIVFQRKHSDSPIFRNRPLFWNMGIPPGPSMPMANGGSGHKG